MKPHGGASFFGLNLIWGVGSLFSFQSSTSPSTPPLSCLSAAAWFTPEITTLCCLPRSCTELGFATAASTSRSQATTVATWLVLAMAGSMRGEARIWFLDLGLWQCLMRIVSEDRFRHHNPL